MAAEKKTLKESRIEFIMHLLDKGWLPNVDYIDKITGKDNTELEQLLLGELGSEFHLITPCEGYVVKVKSQYAAFWQKKPKWVKLVNARIRDYKLTDQGIQIGIMKLEVGEENVS